MCLKSLETEIVSIPMFRFKTGYYKNVLVALQKHISLAELQWLQTFIGDMVGYSKYCEVPPNFCGGWTKLVQDFFHQQLSGLKTRSTTSIDHQLTL